MPFSHRTFCRVPELPSLSEVLVCLRQSGHQAQILGGVSQTRSSADDLLSCYWGEVQLVLGGDAEETPLYLKCLGPGRPLGQDAMKDAVADFVGDVAELPASSGRERVLEQLASTRAVLVVEFPSKGSGPTAEQAAECITTLFAERADGLAQRDGVGFVDEDDDVILALA